MFYFLPDVHKCIFGKSNWRLCTERAAWWGAKWRRWAPIMVITKILAWLIKVLNIYIYEGSENPFLITRVYSTKWLCSYDMLFYPFDTQVKETQFWLWIQIMFQLTLYRVVPCCWHPLVTQPPRSLFKKHFSRFRAFELICRLLPFLIPLKLRWTVHMSS